MQGVMIAALPLLVIIAVTQTTYAEYDELCARFADGIQFREPGNCRAYVTCNGGVGVVTTCPNDQLYNKDTSKCVARLTDNYCDAVCKGKSNVWVQDPANCEGYYYCDAGKEIRGTCPSGYKFDDSSQMCVYSTRSTCLGVSDFCGILPNGVQFSDPDNCNKYFQCTRGSLRSMNCGTNLYYDVASAGCINKYAVACKAHPIPSNICGRDSLPTYNKFVPDGVTCRGYYYCAYKGAKISDKNPTWHQCPEGYFFNATLQLCMDPTDVTCDYNRCDGRGDSYVIASDFGCRYYYDCRNGVQGEKLKCPRDMFFDESRQACTYDEVFYPVCDY